MRQRETECRWGNRHPARERGEATGHRFAHTSPHRGGANDNGRRPGPTALGVYPAPTSTITTVATSTPR
jgi:hypothetical protein